MTEPNATPAPLTSERCSKRVPMAGVWFRDAQCSRKAVGMFDGAPLCRQHSPAAKAARDAKYEAKFKARLARDMAPTVRLSEALAELDATRAKLAEAEAIVVQSHCDLTTLNRSLTAAESRVAALTEALTNARTHVYCGCSRPRVRHDHDCPRGKVEAALSPSQDAKEARDA